MAVKKVTTKKAAKKSAAKKAPAKKAPVKKAVAKKAAVKKSSPKKVAIKKATTKKATTKKSAVKKSAVKKSAVKKSAVKKSAVKKSAVERIVIPEAPISTRTSRVEIVSTPSPSPLPAPAPVLTPAPATSSPSVVPAKKEGASGRVVAAVVVGIIILGLIVWSQASNSPKDDAAKPTPSASTTEMASPKATPEVTASPTPTAVIISTHEAPLGVVAHYTSTGATIFWKVPSASEGLTGYNIEISVSNGPWKLISSVPSSQMYLDVTKENNTGWTSFRVSSVYSDGEVTPAKAFGLPGTYS